MTQVKCRKLETKHECPVDNVIYTLIDPLSCICNTLGITPHMITTISSIFGILAIYFLCDHKFTPFIIMFSLYYLLDLLDGYHARKYNMCSKLGDYYDHIRDALILLPIFVIVFGRLYQRKMWNCLIILMVSLLLFQLHMSCQELHVENTPTDHDCHSETLAVIKSCQSKTWIGTTRHFGMGTFIVVLVILIYINERKYNHNK